MIYHSSIFYPESKEELSRLVSPIEDTAAHKAFILPHMRLEYIAHLYRSVFSSIPDGRRVVAILPIHRELLERDEGKIMLTAASRIEETTLGPVRIESAGAGDASVYEEEEYSLELLYPFMAYHNPSSTLIPVFTHIVSAENTKKLHAFLKTLDDGNTSFIVSSNMTAKLPQESVAPERDKVIAALERGENLMDQWRKGHVKACGTPAISATGRLGSGRWTLIGVSEKETKAGHAALYMD